MIIGYARVSTKDQSLSSQTDAIRKYAAEKGLPVEIYEEKESGGKANRAILEQAIKNVRPGDVFVIAKLDRLARSTRQLYELTDRLKEKGAEFVSINDNIDTTTAGGKAMFGMLAVFAEFERNMIQERTTAGLEAARKRGKVGGRPTVTEAVKRRVCTLHEAGESASDISKEYGIGRSTVYKILNEKKTAINE